MTEVIGGGTTVQLEGLTACCVATVQALTALSMKHEAVTVGMDNPAEGQSISCPDCKGVLVYKAGAWRSKTYMGVTNYEFGT